MQNEQPSIELDWQAHPLRERPRAGVAAMLVIVMAAVASAMMGGQAWWAIVAVLILVLALNRFFFPSRFSIDAEGITARYPMRAERMRWRDVRRFVQDERGGYLSSRARASRLDAFTGVHILFGAPAVAAGGAGRAEIVQRIRAHVQSPADESRAPIASAPPQGARVESG